MNARWTRSLAATLMLAAGSHAWAQTPEGEPTGWRALLRSENDDVLDGNQQMAAGDPKGALLAYDRAAKSLPSNGGVHLNRGLALLADAQLDPARESLLRATQPPSPRGVRADAHYNLGNAFYKAGDTLAGEQKHEEAQKAFREAVDAYKESLRLRPGNPNAAWNLELAARRLTEEQQKQKEQEEQEEQEKQDQEDEQDQDQDQGDENEDSQDQSGDQQDEPKQDDQQDEPKQDPAEQDKQDKQQEPKADDQEKSEPAPQPSDVQRALDALQDGEDNLERHRAHQRAMRERRKPEKDW